MDRKIVRLADKDLKGEKRVEIALKKIEGIDHRMADAIMKYCSIDKDIKIGELKDETVERLEEVIESPEEKIPSWLLNRRKDVKEGSDLHKFGSDVQLTEQMDIKRMKEIQSWKGIRHSRGLPVRGQKTQSTGRGKQAVGVQRKRIKAERAEREEEGE